MDADLKALLRMPREKRVKMLLEYLDIAQSAIARRSGRSRPFVSMVVTGKERSLPVEGAIYRMMKRKTGQATFFTREDVFKTN